MNLHHKKIYFFLINYFILTNLLAQDSRWIDMFSYLNIFNIQATSEQIYAQSENTLLTYNASTGEMETISSINGLSGDQIQNFYYDENLKKLFVFHEGGLIEIINEQKEVFKSPGLLNNTFLAAELKNINGLFEKDNLIYMAMDYGISIYNLEKNEFGDTYYLSLSGEYEPVYDVAVYNNKIFAATPNGLKVGDLDSNLLDSNNWHILSSLIFQKLVLFKEQLIGSSFTDLYKITSTSISLKYQFSNDIINLNSNQYLSITLSKIGYLLDDNYIIKHTYERNEYQFVLFNDLVDLNEQTYIGTNRYGVFKTPTNQNNYLEIHPDCPLSNHVFTVDAVNKHVWIAGGDYNIDDNFNPFPVYQDGISSYQVDHWVNIPYEDFNVSDLSFIKINPLNVEEVYFSSSKDGILRVRNNQIDKLFNNQNSPLASVSGYTFTYAIDFDSKGNLWITQRGRPELLKLSPNDTWETVSLQSILTSDNDIHGFGALKVDKNDNIWIGTIYKGVVGYNTETHQISSLKTGIDPQSYTIITALDIDQNNTMWAGNIYGLRTLTNPENMFVDPANMEFKPIKIVYEDAVQLLLEGQNITSIKVDGANKKWISTLGSGVYYFNEDGTQTIYHFTTDNSPLPSNDIYDLAIDGSTGIVYFASLNGLIGFKGGATESSENLDDVYAFPNPVNQKKHNYVTIRGLVEGTNIKIVDVAGNLVYETTAKGGSISWDLTAFGKHKVASGVYIAFITDDIGNQTQTTKIMVIK